MIATAPFPVGALPQVILCMVAVLALASPSLAQVDSSVSVRRDGNVYAARGVVRLDRRVDGDLLAAGGKINVDHDVKEDAALVGGTIRVDAPLGGDLRALGGNLEINSRIQGEAVCIGGNIELASAAQVIGRVWLAGGNVHFAGKSGADTTIYADKISVSGEILGDARLVGENIELLPGARIGGKLSYASPNAIKTDPEASISGGVIRETMREPVSHARQANHMGRVGGWLLGVAGGMGIFALGVLLIVLFPRLSSAVEQTAAVSPWRSLALGFAIAAAIPFVAMLLLVTIIGIPLAIATLALYPAVLLLGYLTSILMIADRGARLTRRGGEVSAGWRVLALAVALIALAFIAALPLVGPLVTLLVLLIGVGALALTIYRRISKPDGKGQTPAAHPPPSTLSGSAA